VSSGVRSKRSRHVQRSQCSRSNPGGTRANAGRNKDGGEVADALREKRAVFGEPLTVEK